MAITKQQKQERLAKLNESFLSAAHQGNLEAMIKAQLDGANVNCREAETGRTALHIAVSKGNLLMTRYLADQCNAVFCADARGVWPTLTEISSKKNIGRMCDFITEAETRYLRRIGDPEITGTFGPR